MKNSLLLLTYHLKTNQPISQLPERVKVWGVPVGVLTDAAPDRYRGTGSIVLAACYTPNRATRHAELAAICHPLKTDFAAMGDYCRQSVPQTKRRAGGTICSNFYCFFTTIVDENGCPISINCAAARYYTMLLRRDGYSLQPLGSYTTWESPFCTFIALWNLP